MISIVLRSYLLLAYVEVMLRRHGFKDLHTALRRGQTQMIDEGKRVPHGLLCHAMDLACVFYPHAVHCLQRSAATVFLLRRYGWPGEFVTGSAIATFENHAWVELAGHVVNDKPYMQELYQVLDRS